jgi:hypothetical protein
VGFESGPLLLTVRLRSLLGQALTGYGKSRDWGSSPIRHVVSHRLQSAVSGHLAGLRTALTRESTDNRNSIRELFDIWPSCSYKAGQLRHFIPAFALVPQGPNLPSALQSGRGRASQALKS